MPQKSLNERLKRAKRAGVTLALKASDVGDTGPLTSHAEKKSSTIVAMGAPADRHASRKRPPGKGRNRKTKSAAALAREARPRWKAHGTRAEPGLKKTGSGRSRGSVNGRKKGPRQMKIRRPGGPRDRSPLHGG